MGKVADMSPRKRGKVEAMLAIKTLSQRDIAQSLGISQKAVHTVKKRLDMYATSSPRRSSCGRNMIMTPRARRILVSECKKNRKMTSKQLQGVMESHDVTVSTSCIRRHLIQAGLVARRPRKKPLLNDAQRRKISAMGKGPQTLDC